MAEGNLENPINNRGIGEEGWKAIFITIIIVIVILWLCGFNFGRVNEGYVDSSDCRNTIILEEGSWETYFGKFICDNGYCSKLKIKKEKCETEYYYIKEKE